MHRRSGGTNSRVLRTLGAGPRNSRWAQVRWQRNRVSRASFHPYSRAEVTANRSAKGSHTNAHKTRRVRDGRRSLEHQGSARCEQRGGFHRTEEEFNGAGTVVSYLNNKGDNHETHDNRTSNCIRSSKHIRARTRRNARWKPRQLFRRHRCGRPHCKQAQECYWEYVCSHRA